MGFSCFHLVSEPSSTYLLIYSSSYQLLSLQNEEHHHFPVLSYHHVHFNGPVLHVHQNRFPAGRESRIGHEPGYFIPYADAICHYCFYRISLVEEQ